MVLIATVSDLDVYLSDSVLAERYATNAGSQMFIHRMKNQSQISNPERPLAKLNLKSEGENVFMPIAVGHVKLISDLLIKFEEILDIDPRHRHKITGRKQLMEMLGQIETVFHGSQVIGPEILLPA